MDNNEPSCCQMYLGCGSEEVQLSTYFMGNFHSMAVAHFQLKKKEENKQTKKNLASLGKEQKLLKLASYRSAIANSNVYKNRAG